MESCSSVFRSGRRGRCNQQYPVVGVAAGCAAGGGAGVERDVQTGFVFGGVGGEGAAVGGAGRRGCSGCGHGANRSSGEAGGRMTSTGKRSGTYGTTICG